MDPISESVWKAGYEEGYEEGRQMSARFLMAQYHMPPEVVAEKMKKPLSWVMELPIFVYHGSGGEAEKPDLRQVGFPKDFGQGFYCAELFDQAARWARRHHHTGEAPTVTAYEAQKQEGLSWKVFSEMTEEWLDFVVACRSGQSHDYDVVEGPMVDDTIWNYLEDFRAGQISRELFWGLVRSRHPVRQVSFHTPRGLQCLRYIESQKVGE